MGQLSHPTLARMLNGFPDFHPAASQPVGNKLLTRYDFGIFGTRIDAKFHSAPHDRIK